MDEPSGRTLGVDFGDRRIGLAVGDPTGFLASALEVVESKGRARDAATIAAIAAREGATTIVLGLPVNMKGETGPQAEKVRRFGDALARETPARVEYWDERLTTVEAQRYLIDAGMNRRKRAATIDAAAAAVLLQGYLDSRRRR